MQMIKQEFERRRRNRNSEYGTAGTVRDGPVTVRGQRVVIQFRTLSGDKRQSPLTGHQITSAATPPDVSVMKSSVSSLTYRQRRYGKRSLLSNLKALFCD